MALSGRAVADVIKATAGISAAALARQAVHDQGIVRHYQGRQLLMYRSEDALDH